MTDKPTVNTAKTISLKSLGLDIPKGGGDFIGKTVALFDCAIDGSFNKMTNFGESIALTGRITAINNLNGQVFSGDIVYLPADTALKIQGKLEKNPGAIVTIECEVVVAASEKAARGYTYITREISTPEVINERQRSIDKLLAKQAALPKPEEKKAIANSAK